MLTRRKGRRKSLGLPGSRRDRSPITFADTMNKHIMLQGINDHTNAISANRLAHKLMLAQRHDRTIAEFNGYRKLCLFCQGSMSIHEYIFQYKRICKQIKLNGVHLPKNVLIFQLLQGSNLTIEEQKLVLMLRNNLKLKPMFLLLKWMAVVSVSGRKCFRDFVVKDAGGGIEGHCAVEKDVRENSSDCGDIYLGSEGNKQFSGSDMVSNSSKNFNKPNAEAENIEELGSEYGSSELTIGESEGFGHVATIHLTEDREKFDVLIEEANSAVMNTQCVATVAGETWFDNYTKKLSPLQRRTVKTTSSTAIFKIIGRPKTTTLKTAVFPVKIGTHVCTLQAEILDANIPLLLGKTCLKDAGTLIDVENEKAKIFGNSIELHTTFGGLYYFNLFPNRVCNEYMYKQENRNGAIDANLARACGQEKQIMQLHYDYGHASAGNLRRLVRSAGIMTTKLNTIIENVINECRKCNRKPPEVDDFNKRVFVGFHQLDAVHDNKGKAWYMQITDEHTGFSNAAFITNKEASVRIFLKCWLCLFGAPTTVVIDTSTKFTGQDFDEMCRTFGISVSATPSSLLWSSGVCARNHASLSTIYDKIQTDNKCDNETALLWAISAKNSVVNKNGATPSQLVFGKTESGSVKGLSDKQAMFRASLRSSDLSTLRMARAALDEMRNKGIGRRHKSQFESLLDVECQGEKRKRESGQVDDGSTNKMLVPVLFLRKGSEYVKAYVCRVQAAMDKRSSVDNVDEQNKAI